MANESPEVIEKDMHDTRQSLADKLAALEGQVTQTLSNVQHAAVDTVHALTDSVQGVVGSVTGGIQSVRGAVEGTVESVSGGVHSLMGDGTGAAHSLMGDGANLGEKLIHGVTDQVKKAFDPTDYVAKQPYAAVGVAAAAGFVAGLLFAPARRGSSVPPPSYAYQPAPAAPRAAGPIAGGIFDDLFKLLGEEVRKIGQNAIHSLSQQVNQTVQQGAPKLVDSVVHRVADGLGGGPDAGTPPAGPDAGRGPADKPFGPGFRS